MVKLNGKIGQLLKEQEPNKRGQLVHVSPTNPRTTYKRSKKKPGVVYRTMKLELPEDLKQEVDLLFATNRKLQEYGKNNWLIAAVREKLKADSQRYD